MIRKIYSFLVKYIYLSSGQINNSGKKIAGISFILPNIKLGPISFKRSHPNQQELNLIKDYFHFKDYEIKLFDFRFNRSLNQFDVLFGFGSGFFVNSSKSNLKIYYATGSSFDIQNSAVQSEIEYLSSLDLDLKLSYEFFRVQEPINKNCEIIADVFFLIGNNYTQKGFLEYSKPIFILPGIPLGKGIVADEVILTDSLQCIYWIGSKGFLHKGFHIACAVASRLNSKLVALGIQECELDYAKKIANHFDCNCDLFGFLEVDSVDWKRIVLPGGIILGCSISEGMSTAILTGISYGLYPISTDSCGIDSGIVVPILPRNELINNLAKEILIFWSYGIEVRRELILRVMYEVSMHNNAQVFKEKFTSHMNLLLN